MKLLPPLPNPNIKMNMVKDNNIKAMAETERSNTSEPEISAVDKVFSSYELIQAVTLALPADGIQDILAMAQVNKACYEVSISSNLINKHFISSVLFYVIVFKSKNWIFITDASKHPPSPFGWDPIRDADKRRKLSPTSGS